MPCFDIDPKDEKEYENEKQLKFLKEENEYANYVNHENKKEIKFLKGALCAVLSELDRHKISHQIIQSASRHGLIGLMEWWNEHKSTDETRLANILHGYSVHEQKIMQKLLNQGNVGIK